MTSGNSYQYIIGMASAAPSFLVYFPLGTLPNQTWSCVGNPSALQTGQTTVGISGSTGVYICHSGTLTTTTTNGKTTVVVNNLTLDELSGDGGMPTRLVSALLTCP